jgi:lysyl-tRNA synthetase class 2
LALEDDILRQRYERLAQIESLGFDPYGHAYEVTHEIPKILAEYEHQSAEELAEPVRVRIAGRVQSIRRMGKKAGFLHLLQQGEKLQLYIRQDAMDERSFALYNLLDIGDIVGASGYLFRTKTGELSVHVESLTFL